MENKHHEHAVYIDAIPRQAVLERFGLNRAGLWAWRNRGIPHKARGAFAKLAVDYKVALPQSYFDGDDQ